MKLRGRLLVSTTALVLLPLLGLAFLLRREMRERLRDQYQDRVDALITVIEQDLREREAALGSRLAGLAIAVPEDDRLRRALVSGGEQDRSYVLDYAGEAAALMGLDLLQIQSEDGRILSSGHYRNEFDRMDPDTPSGLIRLSGRAGLVFAQRPEGAFVALARVDSVRLGGTTWWLVGGTEIDEGALRGLSPEDALVVSLVHSRGIVSGREGLADESGDPAEALGRLRRGGYLVRGLEVPEIGSRKGPALLVVTHSLAPVRELLASLDGYLVLAFVLAAGGTILVALGLSWRVSRPLERLAAQADRLDLDRLDVDFPDAGGDEVGTLSRLLGRMTHRLRGSLRRLRDAERRATLGDVARQVNHDLRNGFTPIRNVVRHLSETAGESPEKLPAVFAEREPTLRSGLDYLEHLATSYARLARGGERVPCDLLEIVRRVVDGQGGAIRVEAPAGLPAVLADPVGLRRVVENLITNAVESGADGPAPVDVSLELLRDEPAVRLVVRDEGVGIEAERLERVFEDFFTTKETGTGLGLSIVRRLVSDFEGTIEIDSEVGAGTTVTVTLPAAREARA